jgi:hypothetical protein
MNLIKYGIASVVVACAAVAACGGSSSSNGSSSGAGTSTGGTSSSTGGTSTSGGGTTSHGGTASGIGGAFFGTGGCTGSGTLPPASSTSCPAGVSCAESHCKTQIMACDTGGLETCLLQSCFNELLACGMMGTGGTGSGGTFGTGGTFSFGGNAGTFPAFDAGSATCADLATCCASLSDAQEKSACNMIVAGKSDPVCSLTLSGLCPAM